MNTVTVALMTQGHVLLLQRNPDAYPGYADPFGLFWELIGGHVEPDEEPLIAALREVWEETRINLVPAECQFVSTMPFPGHGSLATNYLYQVSVPEELPVKCSHEHHGFAWTRLAQARTMKLAFKHSVLLERLVSAEESSL
jgi:8-oxo-dGTP diphosphatase